MTKTGEVYDRDIDGALWLCELWCDAHGTVTTTRTAVPE